MSTFLSDFNIFGTLVDYKNKRKNVSIEGDKV